MSDFSEVLTELEQLESELEAIRVVMDEGVETYTGSRTARESALRHLDGAMRHLVDSAWGLIEETDWDEPEDNLDAIEILAEEDVIPGPLAVTLTHLAEYASEHGEEAGWDAEIGESYERLGEAADSIAVYLEDVHEFLKQWET